MRWDLWFRQPERDFGAAGVADGLGAVAPMDRGILSTPGSSQGMGTSTSRGLACGTSGPRVACDRVAVEDSFAEPNDPGVMISVRELFDAGHFAGVVAVCTEALELRPTDAGLLFERARAWAALRRLDQAQGDLRELLRLHPRCGQAYRMLGQLLARSGKLATAREAFRRALQLNSGDLLAREQFLEVESKLAARILRERLVAEQSTPHREARSRRLGAEPAADGLPEPLEEVFATTRRIVIDPTAEAQPSMPTPVRAKTSRSRASSSSSRRAATANGGHSGSSSSLRRAGTVPMVHASGDSGAIRPAEIRHCETTRPISLPGATTTHARASTSTRDRASTSPMLGRPATIPGVSPHGRAPGRAHTSSVPREPEPPGFAEYLVSAGVLSVERLRSALDHQRATGVTLATAVVALGLASPQRMESAVIAHQATRQLW
jgi:hypothetical protein